MKLTAGYSGYTRQRAGTLGKKAARYVEYMLKPDLLVPSGETDEQTRDRYAERATDLARMAAHYARRSLGETDTRGPYVSSEVRYRCNRCKRAMKGTTAYDGACRCGGLIEKDPIS